MVGHLIIDNKVNQFVGLNYLISIFIKTTTKNNSFVVVFYGRNGMGFIKSEKKITEYLKVFLLGTLMMLLIFVPELIKNKGFFIYGGDYLAQQIPFYYHCTDAVHNGSLGWDWLTDLGSSFIGSYSFYLLGSPFFWLISVFSSQTAVILMPYIIALKTGIATLTAYIYIRRYAKTDMTAVIGALLYAFSGFQMYNIVFNHFHDVTALFPLLILSFDMLVEEDKKGFFAVMTAVMALVNYFFFFGQVVFILLYFIVRCMTKSFQFSLKKLINIAFEAVTGAMISAVLLIPSALEVISNPRVSGVISGTDAVSYSDNTIIPKILQSMFMIPDFPSMSQLFQSDLNQNNWASVSLFLPFFAVIGVVSYIVKNRKDWITKLLLVCLTAACIPMFNSAFFMFNSTYYARWFYMPILFMAIATVKCLDDDISLMPGVKFQGAALLILLLVGLLPRQIEQKSDDLAQLIDGSGATSTQLKAFAMSRIPEIFFRNITFGLAFVLIIVCLVKKYNSNIIKKFLICTISSVMVISVIYINDKFGYMEPENYKENVINYTPELEDDSFYRINSINGSGVDYSLVWNKNSIQMFHSIVPGSISDFYKNTTGKDRMMSSEYDQKQYPVFGLLSVKYIFNGSTGDDLNVEFYPADLDGFTLYDKQDCMYIYKNDHYVPMGFTYNYCISESELEKFLDSQKFSNNEERYHYKQLIMLRALILSDEDAERCKDILPEIPEEQLNNLDIDTYYSDCDERAANSCTEFSYDSDGFKAQINQKNDGIVFFSVPVHDGWSAKVNGEDADIITAHYGLTAVKVSSGDNVIEFAYKTPGLTAGLYVTGAGLCILMLYLLINFINKKYNKKIFAVDDISIKKARDCLMSDCLEYKAFYICIFAVSVIIPFIMVFLHEDWRDEGQSWFMAKELSIGGLLSDAKYEGHPILWHIILMPFAKAGMPIITMNFISVIICSIGSYFLIFKVRLNNLFKTMLVISPFTLYLFSVISRSYSLCYLCLCLLMYMYPVRKQRPILYSIIIAVTFNTHILLAGTAGALVLLDIIDCLKERKQNKKFNYKSIIGIFIEFAGALVVLVILFNSLQVNGEVKADKSVTELLSQAINKYIPVFSVQFLNTNISPGLLTAVLSVSFVIVTVFLTEHPRALLVNTVSIGFVMMVFLFLYGASCQKASLIYVICALVCVIVTTDKKQIPAKADTKPGNLNIPVEKIISGVTCVFLLMNFIGYKRVNWYQDVDHHYSFAKSAASFINNNVSEKSTLVCVPDENISSIKAYAQPYEYWSIFADKESSFTVWTNERKRNLEAFEERLKQASGENDDQIMDAKLDIVYEMIPDEKKENELYLIITDEYADCDLTDYNNSGRYQLVYDFHDYLKGDGIHFSDEEFYIFKLI